MLQDLRYPFETILAFYGKGYFLKAAAAHLVFAHVLLIGFVGYVLSRYQHMLSFVFASLFVCLNFARNPSFHLFGADLPEFFLVAFYACQLITLARSPHAIRVSKLELLCYLVGAFLAVHSLVVFGLYDLGNTADLKSRFLLVLRPLLTVRPLFFLYGEFRRDNEKLLTFASFVSISLLLSSLVYVFQLSMFVGGVVPFGTMASAGFGGQRFGGMSVEGGHLSKFSVPLLIVLMILPKQKWHERVLLISLAVFLLNVSASGYIILFSFLAFTALLYVFQVPAVQDSLGKMRVLIPKKLLIPIFLASLLGPLLLVFKFSTISGLFGKVVDALFRAGNLSNDFYGRSPLIIPKILEKFPLGIGYGGSTQRNIAIKFFPELGPYEINLGFNAFVVQFSFLSVFLIILYGYFTVRAIASVLSEASYHSSFQKSLLLSAVLVPWVVYFVDVLWALPQLWIVFAILPILLRTQMRHVLQKRQDLHKEPHLVPSR